MINWHRLFGLALADYFTGTGYQVEMEKEVARKRQLLDIVIIRAGAGPPPPEPCAGLEDLRPHNLLTYKSGREALDAWALEELIGHYVNYRKSFAPQAPATDFGLYAVATRRPAALARDVALQRVQEGVYTVRALSRPITVIVLKDVPAATRNALWALFSFEAERVTQGARDYVWRQADHLSLLRELYHRYQHEGIAMAYTFEDFERDLARRLVLELPPEERLRGLPPEERLCGLTPEERLRGLPPEERLRGLPPEERLRGLSEEELRRLRQLLDTQLKH
jgi:hypothetical protein